MWNFLLLIFCLPLFECFSHRMCKHIRSMGLFLMNRTYWQRIGRMIQLNWRYDFSVHNDNNCPTFHSIVELYFLNMVDCMEDYNYLRQIHITALYI